MKSKSFFATLKHPYYIYTFDYRQSSAGIRVLHYLCHALNLIGEEAYVNCKVTNAKLRTPKLTDKIRARHRDLGLQPIAIYPEVVFGNPTHAPVVARYILNKPGHLGGDSRYDPNELLFTYAHSYLPEDMYANLLFIPPVDTIIFNNLDNEFDKNRHGSCFYANKFLSSGGQLTDIVKGATDLSLRIPRSPLELAGIMRRSEVLYCYEPSAITVEALLCGCPVVHVLTEYMSEVLGVEILGNNGQTTTANPDGLEYARATVGNVAIRYRELEEQAWNQLAQFVDLTQTAAEARYQEAKLLCTPTPISDRDLHTPIDLSPTLSTAASQPLLSVIICSIDDERFASIDRNYRNLLATIPHEIIRINDAKSLCEGYNRGIDRSRGKYLIFSHDDIEIWTSDFGHRLLRHLEHCDVVGIAGTDLLVNANTSRVVDWTWGGAGPAHVFGRIVTLDEHPDYPRYSVTLFGVPALLISGMQALDGVFIAAHSRVVKDLRFDAETFDGFHLYDMDFTYRAFQNGFRVGVMNDIAVVHYSHGRYDEQWWSYNQRFLNKFEGIIPKRQTIRWRPSIIAFQQIDEVLAFYEDSISTLPQNVEALNNANEGKSDDSDFSDIAAYRRWCERQQVGEGWAEIVGERMVKRWQIQPTFHIVIWCEPGQQSALADTLESLGQQLYEHWGLSVLAAIDCPDASFAAFPNIEWVKVDSDTDTALYETLKDSALDWFALMEPGDRLAPQALLKIADYVNQYPTWRFIYLDEDQLDLRGERLNPIFRPEFDPDLLFGTHYLGDFCVVNRKSVSVPSNLPYLPGLTTFQAALNIWETYGSVAIGHIADVLYHRTVVRSPVADAEVIARARRQLVENYFAEHQIDAVVEGALLPGTWRTVYSHPIQPKVSVIILARDALDRLDRCLRRLLTGTIYPDYEVLVVDCGSQVDDTLDLYAELKARYPENFRTVPAQGMFSIPAYRNQGASQAQGEVLIFLSGSALVVQAEWINRLISHVLRDDVGVVGARMATPDRASSFVYGTAQVLGMRGVSGPLFAGLSLRGPGPFGRAQVDQTVSAVSADCLAIRRQVFKAVNGFDEAFTIAHSETDLCLRAAQHGYRTVWTPFANLAWLGEYPLVTGYNSHELAERARADAERMYERWLPQMAADRAYSRHLSLATPRRIEAELAPGWDTTFHDRPRVLGFPVDDSGCGLYRAYAPLWLLEHQALAECTLIKPGSRLPELVELERMAPDTLFYQSTVGDLGLAAMRLYRRFHRSFKVFDLDDLKHDVPDANSLKERLVRDVKYRHRIGLQECDRLTVSTEPLAEACRQWITDIQVVPNRLERARWCHLRNQRRAGSKPRVGWAGAQQHHGDLAFISEAIQQTRDEVDWVFFGMCLDELRPYVKEVHGWVALNDYPAKLASLNLDLAVAPLDQHPFNEAKSNLRILEHGILGRPMVCTDIYPYRNAPVRLVPNETDAWIEAIRAYVHDLDAAEREGDALQAWVMERYILDDHVSEWLRALTP